jgi:fumarate reductase subunit C
MNLIRPKSEAERQLLYEVVSGASGVALALFMFGHTVFVGSILTGERGFDSVAKMFEDYYIARPSVIIILLLFLVHAAFASRKIPAQLSERREMLRLGKDLNSFGRGWSTPGSGLTAFTPHIESLLWIWQVRTGMVMLVLGSFHIILVGVDVFTPLFGERVGIEASTTLERERAGLWIVYALLTICVAFHIAVGLYRLAVKWGAGATLSRKALWRCEQVILWGLLGLGALTLAVMSGMIEPPLAGLIGAAS